jgi:hypothetical protein
MDGLLLDDVGEGRVSIEARLRRLERLMAPPADDPYGFEQLSMREQYELAEALLVIAIERDGFSAEAKEGYRAELSELQAHMANMAKWPHMWGDFDEARVAAFLARLTAGDRAGHFAGQAAETEG